MTARSTSRTSDAVCSTATPAAVATTRTAARASTTACGLTAQNLAELNWLPPTCAYRLIGAGGDLYWWHPLVSGDPESVHAAGISVRGRVVADEDALPDDKLTDHIVSWPGKWPKGARERMEPGTRAGAPRPNRKFSSERLWGGRVG